MRMDSGIVKPHYVFIVILIETQSRKHNIISKFFGRGLMELLAEFELRTYLIKFYERYARSPTLWVQFPVNELRTLARPQLPHPEVPVSTHLPGVAGFGKFPLHFPSVDAFQRTVDH